MYRPQYYEDFHVSTNIYISHLFLNPIAFGLKINQASIIFDFIFMEVVIIIFWFGFLDHFYKIYLVNLLNFILKIIMIDRFLFFN
jgi:hypothetical protein